MAPQFQETFKEPTKNLETGFKKEANLFPGDNGQPHKILPPWINAELVLEGQKFVRENFFLVFFAHFISLIFLLCYAPVRNVLKTTGRSSSTLQSRKRYFSTLLHIKIWYEEDLINTDGAAFQDIERVRNIHSGVSNMILKNKVDQSDEKWKSVEVNGESVEDAIEEDKSLREAIQHDLRESSSSSDENSNSLAVSKQRHFPISQLDMAVTQFCFMGFVLLFNEKSEMINEKCLKGFIHLWAVIGFILGIDDKFNICLEENSHQRNIILHEILIPNFKECHPDTVQLWKSLILGISDYIYFIKLKSVLLFTSINFLNTKQPSKLESLLSFYERRCYKAMCKCFYVWLKYLWLKSFFNSLLRLAIFLTELRFGMRLKQFDLKETIMKCLSK